MSKKVVPKSSEAASSEVVISINKDSFIICDDLRILPNETGLFGIINILDITDMGKAELFKVDLGFNEIINLLKASLTSPTPLSDLTLTKTRQINSAIVELSQPKISLPQIAKEDNPNNSRNLCLKVMIQKSTGKLLYAQAKEDFVEFLFSLLIIPVGGAKHLLAGKTCIKAIDNLYRSTTDLIDSKYFKTSDMKKKANETQSASWLYFQKPHSSPTEELLPAAYPIQFCSSAKFPNGRGSYLKGPRTYQVKDDLTVMPFCIVSILSGLREKEVQISDVEQVELQIGLKEALSILKASH